MEGYDPPGPEGLHLAQEVGLFHWPLEFPEVFEVGGFDVMLGNPPWAVAQLVDEKFFSAFGEKFVELLRADRDDFFKDLAENHPEIYEKYLYAGYQSAAFSKYLKNSRRYNLSNKGKINSYSKFAEILLTLTRLDGAAGVVLPIGILTESNNAEFVENLFDSGRLSSVRGFYEIRGIFKGTDSRGAFCLLTIKASSEDPTFIFSAQTPEDFQDERRQFSLNSEIIRRLNPNTPLCPVFQSQVDAELIAKIYENSGVFVVENSPSGNPWKVQFRQGLFNITGDRPRFRKADELNGDRIAIRSMSNPQGEWLPLYEAKMIHIFDHRYSTYDGDRNSETTLDEKSLSDYTVTPRFFVKESEVRERLLPLGWTHDWFIGFRDVLLTSNERSCIASVVPLSGVGHSCSLIFSEHDDPRMLVILLANISSLAFDYVVRRKVGGSHLTFPIVSQLPVLAHTSFNRREIEELVSRAVELVYTADDLRAFASDVGKELEPYTWNSDRRQLLQAELDAFFAYLYGLTRDELCYILDPADVMGPDYPSETFRVLKNNEIKEFDEYRTRRLVLEAWDRFAEDGTFDQDEIASRESIAPITEAIAEGRSGVAGINSVAVQIEQVQPEQPVLFVEGETDIKILSAAWSVFYPDEEFPLEFKSAGGTTQMGGLATRGKALLELIGDRVVCALADNDADGRALWNDGNLHKGAVWKQQTNGVNWCLLKPTDEFLEVMADHQVPRNCWPFTIESCFSAALRRRAVEEGKYGLVPGAHADLTHNPEVAQRMLQALPTLTTENDALFYLQAPDPQSKVAFADWVTSPERCTPENYAAFEDILVRLRAILDPATDQAA